MKPRIMASTAEINMTPIRIMSRSVMGMAKSGPSQSRGHSETDESERRKITAKKCCAKPAKHAAPVRVLGTPPQLVQSPGLLSSRQRAEGVADHSPAV